LEQGDLLPGCPLLLLPTDVTCADFLRATEAGESQLADLQLADVVVMSQTCDLAHHKLSAVMLCSYYSLDDLTERNPDLGTRGNREKLRQGHFPAYHLVNQSRLPGFVTGLQVVDFKDVHGLPVQVARDFAENLGPRLRLLPPYREHLAQAFARYFMRVGLPVDIPPFQ